MQFCPRCDNILKIERTAPKAAIDLVSTPTSVSDSNNSHAPVEAPKIEKIINLLKKTEALEELNNVTFDTNEITKHKNFTTLPDKDKELILKNIEKITSSEALSAYKVCKNCSYYEKIGGRTLVISKISKDTNTVYDDTSKYSYMVHDDTVPHTRGYICMNKACASHKDFSKRDAIWFRPIIDSYQTYMICTECKKMWQTN